MIGTGLISEAVCEHVKMRLCEQQCFLIAAAAVGAVLFCCMCNAFFCWCCSFKPQPYHPAAQDWLPT